MNTFQIKRIKQALEDPEPLTLWEADFINSLADKEEDYELSEAQNKVLNRIAQKYV